MASFTSDPVLIINVMGRKIGFIAASARLADLKREMPLLIILPESMENNNGNANLEFITDRVNTTLKKHKRCIVVIGEGEMTLAEIVEKTVANDKRLPDVEVLNKIPGIAFLEETVGTMGA